MELAGLEPATSWVRSRRSLALSLAYLQGFHVGDGRAGGGDFRPVSAHLGWDWAKEPRLWPDLREICLLRTRMQKSREAQMKGCPGCRPGSAVGRWGGTRAVLIVDDHDGFRAGARALLEADGFEVLGEAADGSAALEAVRRLRPEVVLLDVQLPGTDGF